MQDIYIGDEGKGFPLVLIHGFLGSSRMWELQIDFFKEYFRVITPDLPGFGKSNKAKSHNSIQSIANLLLECLVEKLPIAPPFFPKDELTDKPIRFFVSEIVREKILTHYKQEIPYSCEVVVEEFIDEPTIYKIRAEIRVARESQKYIVVGSGGKMIKRVGTDSRKELELFLGKKVFLDLYVRVDKDWRNDEGKLKRFGYFD